MVKWSQAGKQVSYVLLTSGDKGSHDPDLRPGRLAGRRESEQRAAAAELGVGHVIFLRHPDGILENTLELRRELTAILREHRPHIVLTIDPWRHYQLHPDHRAVAEAFLSLWAGAPGRGLVAALPAESRVAFYEVSQPIRPNVLVDVSEFAVRKDAAVAAFVSQLGGHDYAAFARGLASYRRMSLPATVTSAEGFFVVPLRSLPSADPLRLARAIGPTLRADEAIPPEPDAPATEGPRSVPRPVPPRTSGAPLVSVIVRTKDRLDLLEEAIGSVAAENGVDLEVVVVNDGGADAAGVLARFPSLPVRVVDLSPGRGRAGAANAGARAAAGNALMEAVLDLTPRLRAAALSLDRYSGAANAGELYWASEQAASLIYFKEESGTAMNFRRIVIDPQTRDLNAPKPGTEIVDYEKIQVGFYLLQMGNPKGKEILAGYENYAIKNPEGDMAAAYRVLVQLKLGQPQKARQAAEQIRAPEAKPKSYCSSVLIARSVASLSIVCRLRSRRASYSTASTRSRKSAKPANDPLARAAWDTRRQACESPASSRARAPEAKTHQLARRFGWGKPAWVKVFGWAFFCMKY